MNVGVYRADAPPGLPALVCGDNCHCLEPVTVLPVEYAGSSFLSFPEFRVGSLAGVGHFRDVDCFAIGDRGVIGRRTGCDLIAVQMCVVDSEGQLSGHAHRFSCERQSGAGAGAPQCCFM